jgi:MFS family permease
MFTIAAVATNVFALPVGTILDRYGPRVCGITGSILIAIGSVLFATGRDLPFDGFTPGYFFLALGGPFVFISSFQLSNCFPAHSGLILALLTGAFDSSSALFLIFRLIFEGTHGRVTTRALFLIYLVVPVFILVVQITIMPSQSYKTVGEIVKLAEDEVNAPTPDEPPIADPAERERRSSEHRARRESVITEINSLLETSTNAKRAKREDTKNKKSGVWGALHGHSAYDQIKTPWFWLITMFTVVQMTRINYFVATVRPQYKYLLHSDSEAKKVNQIFDVLLPVGGVLSIPFIGSILDRTSTPFALACLVVTATLIGILGVIPQMWAAIANICLFGKYHSFSIPSNTISNHPNQNLEHSGIPPLLLHRRIRLLSQSLRFPNVRQSLRPHHLLRRTLQFHPIPPRRPHPQSVPQQPVAG